MEDSTQLLAHSWRKKPLAIALAAAGLILAALLGTAQGGTPPERPNLLFILADDLGWRDTSLYGSALYRTPHIDRLARRGMMFTQAYAASPFCSPTRASILTGCLPARLGVTTAGCHLALERLEASVARQARAAWPAVPCCSATRLSLGQHTLAEALQAAGYRTGHFGKWHLGAAPYDPASQGFDTVVPDWSGGGPRRYLAPWKIPGLEGRPGEHLEDRMAEEAAAFMRRNRQRPFFLNYWAFSVHGPFQAKPAYVEQYGRRVDPQSPQHNALYAAMVASLDDAVGRLLDTLDELGLTERTIVVFTSDNGGVPWPDATGTPVTSALPLRGGKGTLYEGGLRVPCIVCWPGVVQPGSRSEALLQSADFYPTLLEMLGLQTRPGQPLDGRSFVPALTRSGPLPRDTVHAYLPHYVKRTGQVPAASVRQGDWKLMRFFHDGPAAAHRYELYDLGHDPGETTNLAGSFPERVARLDGLIESFLRETGAVLPRANPAYAPSAARAPRAAQPGRVATTAPSQSAER